MLERYGVAHALESAELLAKSEATQLARYGVKHAAQNESIKQATQQQFMDKYGVATPFQLPDFQAKTTKTCLERYGVAYTSQIPGRTEKMRATNLQRYGSTYPLGNADIQQRVEAHMQRAYGVPYYCMTDECRALQKQTISEPNKAVMKLIQDAGLTCYPEAIKIDRYSYDIYVPECNTVIEVNPTATHNAVNTPWSPHGKDKYYHRNKTQLAVNAGYRCINIWDWDTVDKIIQSLISTVTIGARVCSLRAVPVSAACAFENQYHFQGKVSGQTVCLGLYLNEELIQLMTFGKPRYNKNYRWELLRLCTRSGDRVIGGAERLWAEFIRHYDPESVISYCDRSKFMGSVYVRLGMTLSHIAEPNRIWSRGHEYVTDNFLRQHGYDQLFGTDHGKGTDNDALMIEENWLPVYDCGQAVYVYHR